MLTTLRIKNLALVADLTLELQPGYNVITGETGAGKSILIGALNLALGERADRTLIRSGSDSCSVEAVFDVARLKAPLQSFLEENGLEPCEDHQLVLKRTFTSAGTNRQFVNGSPTTLNILATLGEWLVDIHGPHEHQSLLHPARQLAILDAFGGLDARARGLWRPRPPPRCPGSGEGRADRGRKDLRAAARPAPLSGRRDFRRPPAAGGRSAGRAGPSPRQQRRQTAPAQPGRARFAERERDFAAHPGRQHRPHLAGIAAGGCLRRLRSWPCTSKPWPRCSELQAELSHYSDKVDIDPARLQQLEERLNLIHSLKRKYGATLAEVIAFGEEARRKLQSLEQRDAELARLNAELQKLDAELWRAGQALSAKRRKVIPQLSKAASKQLADLGFKQSRLDVALTTLAQSRVHATRNHAITQHGLDTIEFQFAPNPGEPARPLRAIASSGELARVMLALKTVLAAEDQIPVLVFDEVDANVGGETANAVGEKMQQIAQKRQVLCITHLPQVAAPASAHYVATKQVKAGRTISEITLLDPKERVTELARMLGGQTDAARKHAEALLEG